VRSVPPRFSVSDLISFFRGATHFWDPEILLINIFLDWMKFDWSRKCVAPIHASPHGTVPKLSVKNKFLVMSVFRFLAFLRSLRALRFGVIHITHLLTNFWLQRIYQLIWEKVGQFASEVTKPQLELPAKLIPKLSIQKIEAFNHSAIFFPRNENW
jgi:hypothetical protein